MELKQHNTGFNPQKYGYITHTKTLDGNIIESSPIEEVDEEVTSIRFQQIVSELAQKAIQAKQLAEELGNQYYLEKILVLI